MSVREAFRLDGMLAVVTGASRGLGKAAAVALVEAGASVVLGSRHESGLRAAAAHVAERTGREVDFAELDVSESDCVAAFFDRVEQRHGVPHVLVNCAGVEHSALAVDLAEDDWNRVVQVNLGGTFRCAQRFAQLRGDGGDRSIINIASIGATVGVPTQSAYCASKGAVVSLTRSLALELARDRIRVNALAPGYFRTDMPAAVLADEQLHAQLLRKVPQRRIAEPDEIGGPVVFLASPASAFMTGALIPFDGGYTAQ